MTQEAISEFIVIDDDKLNNLICTKIIQLSLPGATVSTFTDPEKGLDHIRTSSGKWCSRGIVFLDINMPSLSGWEVLDIFEGYPDEVKEHVSIYVVSSSVDTHDKEKAEANPFVSGYIPKALSIEKLRSVLRSHIPQPAPAFD